MKRDNTKIIDQYLSGELSDAKRTEFEKELEVNAELQKELELQKNINEGVKRTSIRNTVKSVGKKYHLINLAKWIGGGIAIVALVATAIYFSTQINNESEKQNESTSKVEVELKNDELINELPREVFSWSGEDTVYLSESGVLISVPSEALLKDGKPYKGKAIIEWQEAIDGATIMKSGLSTMADSNLLETQGMFSFRVQTENGELLDVDEKVGIYVQVPVDEIKPGMELYEGVYDKDSIINWVNPKPLEKLPVPVDMSELDFYPEGYEDTLNKLKLSQRKEFRDSLYLACEYFEGSNNNNYNESVEPENQTKQKIIKQENKTSFEPKLIENGSVGPFRNQRFSRLFNSFESKVEQLDNGVFDISIHIKTKEGIGLHYSDIPNINPTISVEEDSRVDYLELTSLIESNNTKRGNYYIEGDIEISRKMRFENINNSKNVNFSFTAVEIGAEDEGYKCGQRYRLEFAQNKDIEIFEFIPPSKVLAFWNKNFNNTILATRELERRMKTIHSTCDESLLDLYTNNLDKPMYYLDSLALAKGYSSFESFFAERVGKMDIDNPHMEKLQAFYEKGVKELRAQMKAERKKEKEEEKAWDNKVTESKNKESIRTANRNAQAFAEEASLNHEHVRKQLGFTQNFRITRNTIIVNIDREVYAATRNRKTTKVSFNGKTSTIKYNDFSLNVKNHENYNRLYVYLLPDKLNSYQRIDHEKGKVNYPLNDKIIYDVVVLGINETGYFYHEIKKINEGMFGEIKLKAIAESEFEKRISELNQNRLEKPMKIKDELAWLKLEKENYKVQRLRQEKRSFLERMRKVVFPCYSSNRSRDEEVLEMRKSN